MCDYSLFAFPNRLGLDGDELVVYRFSSGCTGFVGAADLSAGNSRRTLSAINWPQLKYWFFLRSRRNGPPAVCVPPGAHVRLEPVDCGLRQRLGLEESEEAVFIQLTADEFSHRDGLQFRNGGLVSLQEVPTGQRAYIVSTSGLPEETQGASFLEIFE